MDFEHVGKCQRCHTASGYLDGKRTHTISGILFSVKIYMDGTVFCESPIFPGDEGF